jgi:hypothetical protein
MRRWSHRETRHSVPSVKKPAFELDDRDRNDSFPKPLGLKRYGIWDGRYPHPVLCSSLGPIKMLANHAHWGSVRRDAEVQLLSSDPTGSPEFPGGARRPTPEVIAWSTLPGADVAHRDALEDVAPAIAIYDGQRANVGRIVVDSSWHNWLDIDVRGTGAPGPATGLIGGNLELVRDYFRNIAHWLATASQRESMRGGLLVHLVANAGGWSELAQDTRLLGERAMNLLGEITSECERSALIFDPWWTEELIGSGDSAPRPLTLPPKEFVSQHVLGAMVQAVLEAIPELECLSGCEKDCASKEAGPSQLLLVARLKAARNQGLREMTERWHRCLDETALFLDAIDDWVGADLRHAP